MPIRVTMNVPYTYERPELGSMAEAGNGDSNGEEPLHETEEQLRARLQYALAGGHHILKHRFGSFKFKYNMHLHA